MRAVETLAGFLWRSGSALAGARWDSQVTILMPIDCIEPSFSFAARSSRELATEIKLVSAHATH
jgi:hypothetical protein